MVLNYDFISTRDAENGKTPGRVYREQAPQGWVVGQKVVEGMEWLVKDLHEELKSWGAWEAQEEIL